MLCGARRRWCSTAVGAAHFAASAIGRHHSASRTFDVHARCTHDRVQSPIAEASALTDFGTMQVTWIDSRRIQVHFSLRQIESRFCSSIFFRIYFAVEYLPKPAENM